MIDQRLGWPVFTKYARESGQPLYEAAGLSWLADGGAKVPEVHEATPAFLSTEFIEAGQPSARLGKKLGRMLALVHASGAPWFGAPPPEFAPGANATFVDGWMGHAPLPLLAKPARGLSWGLFYAQYRIRPYLSNVFTSAQKAEAEELCTLLERGVFDHPQPSAVRRAGHRAARLHGDLWSGNILWSRGMPTLVDPVAQGGHAETDLAMLHTFDTPHLGEIMAGYQEVSALCPGWQDRLDLHKLHILVVHCYLFGTGYVPAFMTSLRRTRSLVR